jgi:hypothetical protein
MKKTRRKRRFFGGISTFFAESERMCRRCFALSLPY